MPVVCRRIIWDSCFQRIPWLIYREFYMPFQLVDLVLELNSSYSQCSSFRTLSSLSAETSSLLCLFFSSFTIFLSYLGPHFHSTSSLGCALNHVSCNFYLFFYLCHSALWYTWLVASNSSMPPQILLIQCIMVSLFQILLMASNSLMSTLIYNLLGARWTFPTPKCSDSICLSWGPGHLNTMGLLL